MTQSINTSIKSRKAVHCCESKKKEKRKSATDNLLPASPCLKHKSWKQPVLVEDGWVVHSHGSPGPFMTVLCWAQMVVLWRLLFSGLKPHSLFLVLACSMTWVQLNFIYFFQLFLWYQLLCLPWIKRINVCFHYAAMGFAEWENMRWTQLSMQHTCWLHTTAKIISDLADEFHASYFILLHFMFIYFYEGCK